MWGYMIFSLVLMSYIFPPSLQSPQNSFFKWPTNEARKDLNNEQPKVNVGQSVQLPVEENLRLMSLKPVNLSSSGERENVKLPSTAQPLQSNLTSGLTNYIGDEISSFLANSVVFLGALLGREGCDLKAACLVGTLVPPLQGRDIAVIAAEPIIPGTWKTFYEAAKSSIIQGQDCSQFSCV